MTYFTLRATFDNADRLQSALESLRKDDRLAHNPTVTVGKQTGSSYSYGRRTNTLRNALIWIGSGAILAAVIGTTLVVQGSPDIATQALVTNAIAWAATGAVAGILSWGLLDVLFNGTLDNKKDDDATFVITAALCDETEQECFMQLLTEQGAKRIERSEFDERTPVQML